MKVLSVEKNMKNNTLVKILRLNASRIKIANRNYKVNTWEKLSTCIFKVAAKECGIISEHKAKTTTW